MNEPNTPVNYERYTMLVEVEVDVPVGTTLEGSTFVLPDGRKLQPAEPLFELITAAEQPDLPLQYRDVPVRELPELVDVTVQDFLQRELFYVGPFPD